MLVPCALSLLGCLFGFVVSLAISAFPGNRVCPVLFFWFPEVSCRGHFWACTSYGRTRCVDHHDPARHRFVKVTVKLSGNIIQLVGKYFCVPMVQCGSAKIAAMPEKIALQE
jgi:hypothetical protein